MEKYAQIINAKNEKRWQWKQSTLRLTQLEFVFSNSDSEELIWGQLGQSLLHSRQEQTGQLSHQEACSLPRLSPRAHAFTVYACTCCLHTPPHALIESSHMDAYTCRHKGADWKTHSLTLANPLILYPPTSSPPFLRRPEMYFCGLKTAEPRRNAVMLYWGQEDWARKPGRCGQ